MDKEGARMNVYVGAKSTDAYVYRKTLFVRLLRAVAIN
jgi:hypothetical protein